MRRARHPAGLGIQFIDPSIYYIAKLPSDVQLSDVALVGIVAANMLADWHNEGLSLAGVMRPIGEWALPYLAGRLALTSAEEFDEAQRRAQAALDELERDEVLTEALGPHIVQHFLAAKRQVWRDYSLQVHDWELDHYLATY